MTAMRLPAMPAPGTRCSWFACPREARAIGVDPVDQRENPICDRHQRITIKLGGLVYTAPEPYEAARWKQDRAKSHLNGLDLLTERD